MGCILWILIRISKASERQHATAGCVGGGVGFCLCVYLFMCSCILTTTTVHIAKYKYYSQ